MKKFVLCLKVTVIEDKLNESAMTAAVQHNPLVTLFACLYITYHNETQQVASYLSVHKEVFMPKGDPG